MTQEQAVGKTQFVATVQVTRQVAEEQWKVHNEHYPCSLSTTIGEVATWLTGFSETELNRKTI